MSDIIEQKESLLVEMRKLRDRYELSKKIGPDYFEPGMMEYLDKSYGSYDEKKGEMILRFESRGTLYEGRTEIIETVRIGDEIRVTRDKENQFNPNNFKLLDKRGQNLGNMAATLCNAMAPLYDSGHAVFNKAFVSYVEPISKRSRHARQAVLFVELQLRLITG